MTKQTRICAIYGRVSTDESFKIDHGSPEQQEHLCREMARQLSTRDINYVVKYVLIEEKGLSGGNTKRPKFQELCRLVDSGQIDVVLSKEISRISRSTMDFCNFMDRCSKHNVAVHIKDLNVDPTTPMGGAMFKILAVVAELERELTRERTKSSLRSALVNNAKLNGGHIPLGFDPNPAAKGFWLINPEEIKQVEFLMTRFAETLSYKQTLIEAAQKGIKAKNGKELTQDSLKSLLENEKFIGIARTTWQGEEKIVELRHGQAISPELFSRVQDAIQKVSKDFKKKNKVHEKRDNLLNGILFYEDGTHFSPTSGKGSSGLTHYYYWNSKNRIRLKAPEIEEAVIRSLRIYEEDKRITSAVDTLKTQSCGQLELVEQQIRQVKTDLQALAQEEGGLAQTLRESGGSLHGRVGDWLNGELQKIDSKRQTLSNQLAVLERSQTHLKTFQLDPRALKTSLKKLFDRFDNADVPTKRGIVRQLFAKVTVYGSNKVEITWRVPAVKEETPFAVKGAWLPETGLSRTDFPPDQVSNFIEFNVIPLYRQESFLRSQYLEKGRSIHEIAAEIFASRSSISKNMRHLGIPLRIDDQIQEGQLAFGKRIKNGHRVCHKKEMDTLRRMSDLRQQGFSYHKIADILNTLAVPTKTRKSKWHGTTVMNMLKASISLT